MKNPTQTHNTINLTVEQVFESCDDDSNASLDNIKAKPFLKWVGGKRSILPELLKRLPKKYARYHEPFLGGGALFFAVNPKEAILSDINFDLILTYIAVRDNLEQLAKLLKQHEKKHSSHYFSEARKRLATETDIVQIAALFIYLNKTCFNGVYRVNKSGMFNVPMGNYKSITLYDDEVMKLDSAALKNAVIEQKPFTQIEIQKNDFFYFDPPYHKTYDGYNGDGFTDEQHSKLAEMCHRINSANAYFMLSNSDTPFIRKLYSDFNIESVSATRSVSCKASQRGKENELIVTNYRTK